ncbi:MAG: mobile mystery protein A [Burkholderiales bacterium]
MTPEQLRLRQLDKALAGVSPLRNFQPPRRGWIHAIRSALGLTTRQMARRLKISQPAYRDSEAHESAGSVSLTQLRRIADAMDCDLVYAVVPRRPLTETVDRRAAELAQQRVRRVAHTMALEDQAASSDVTKAQIAAAKTELLAGRWSRLWE